MKKIQTIEKRITLSRLFLLRKFDTFQTDS